MMICNPGHAGGLHWRPRHSLRSKRHHTHGPASSLVPGASNLRGHTAGGCQQGRSGAGAEVCRQPLAGCREGSKQARGRREIALSSYGWCRLACFPAMMADALPPIMRFKTAPRLRPRGLSASTQKVRFRHKLWCLASRLHLVVANHRGGPLSVPCWAMIICHLSQRAAHLGSFCLSLLVCLVACSYLLQHVAISKHMYSSLERRGSPASGAALIDSCC